MNEMSFATPESIQNASSAIVISPEAPDWVKRRWQELVVEKQTYSPLEMASKLRACVGFNPEWVISLDGREHGGTEHVA